MGLVLAVWSCSKKEGAATSSSPPSSLGGPEGGGSLPTDDAAPGDNPFGDGGDFDDAGDLDAGALPDAQACDDQQGDLTPCDAITDTDAGAATCLTAARCQEISQYLLPRSAGYAMSCVDGIDPGCPQGAVGDCFVSAAELACSPAAPGTPPCDTVATLCSSGDPWGLVDQCLSLAPALTASATSALATCLTQDGACDPDALSACAASLLP
jgi:hypothetical protein